RQLWDSALGESQHVDMPEAQAADFTQLKELDAGIVFRLDLVRFAVQSQLQGGERVRHALRRQRQAIQGYGRQGLENTKELVIGLLILFVFDPRHGDPILSLVWLVFLALRFD